MAGGSVLAVGLIPGLVVYGALRASLATTAIAAILGGLSRDSLSSGPFGLGVLPLLWVGVLLHSRRELVLRDSAWAQAVLGGGAVLAVTLLSLGFLEILGPLLGRSTVEGAAWLVELQPSTQVLPPVGWPAFAGTLGLTMGGAVTTPLVFRVLGWVDAKFDYRRVSDGEGAGRGIREIRRGRY